MPPSFKPGNPEARSSSTRRSRSLPRQGERNGARTRKLDLPKLAKAGCARATEVFDLAAESAREIDDRQERALAMMGVVKALAAAGRLEEAADLAREIDRVASRSRALSAAAGAMASAGDAEADSVFAEARQVAEVGHGFWKDIALVDLAAAFARSERYDDARSIADLLADEHKAEALRHVATALAEAGESAADAVFAEARDALRAGSPNETSLRNELGQAMARSGRISDALMTFRPLGLDEFVKNVAGWAPEAEQRKPGTALALVAGAADVTGWVRSDWRAVAELIGRAS